MTTGILPEKLINPEVPDRRINYTKAVAEIMGLLNQFPELKNMVRLKISKQYD